jgi:hypothetical protein
MLGSIHRLGSLLCERPQTCSGQCKQYVAHTECAYNVLMKLVKGSVSGVRQKVEGKIRSHRFVGASKDAHRERDSARNQPTRRIVFSSHCCVRH